MLGAVSHLTSKRLRRCNLVSSTYGLATVTRYSTRRRPILVQRASAHIRASWLPARDATIFLLMTSDGAYRTARIGLSVR